MKRLTASHGAPTILHRVVIRQRKLEELAMIRVSGRTLALAALALSVVLTGCSTEQIRVPVMRPARVDLSRYRTLAIENITGNGGTAIANDLGTGLTASSYFTVVDRRDVEARMRELRRTRGDLFDPSTVAELGRQIGALALIHGEVVTNEYSEHVAEEEWVEVVRDEKGNVQQEIPHVERTRYGHTELGVNLRVTATATGQLLYSRTITKQSFDQTRATDAVPAAIDPAPLFQDCRRLIVKDLVSRVTPRTDLVFVTLYKDSDIPLLAAGNNLARIGEWDDAIEQYRGALETLPAEYAEYRYMPLFNLGVAYEYTNRFEEAHRHLRDAYRVSAESRIADEIESLKYRERQYAELRKQGLVE